MKISIITTTFNIEKYVEETLESVLSQRGDFSVEYIVFDANSTDGTFEKIKKYKKLVDEGFFEGRNNGITMQIFQEPDRGMYDGIAKGLKLATGDVVAYINGDDYYLPNAFSCVAELFEKFTDLNWLVGTQDVYNHKGHFVKANKFYRYDNDFINCGVYGIKLPVIQQESCFWRRELIELVDLEKFAKFKLAGDYYLWHTFSKNNNKLYSAAVSLSGFRVRPDQKSESFEKYKEEMKLIADDVRPNRLKLLLYKCLWRLTQNGSEDISDTLIKWNGTNYEMIKSLKFKNIIKYSAKAFIISLQLLLLSLVRRKNG